MWVWVRVGVGVGVRGGVVVLMVFERVVTTFIFVSVSGVGFLYRRGVGVDLFSKSGS